MDEFREAVDAADDEAELLDAIRRRISALSARQLEIQEQIESQQETGNALAAELENVEAQLIEQADESVEPTVESIDDLRSLPEDVQPEIDPVLLARTRAIRERAAEHHEQTQADGETLQAELRRNDEELSLHRDVVEAIQDGETSVEDASERLLAFDPDDAGD